MCEPDLLANMGLEVLNTVQSEHKPQLERTEPTAKRYLPVLKKGFSPFNKKFQGSECCKELAGIITL
jgi:hypothetical protein